jgi:ADP-heptose:LPS heptosyltransferase
MYTPLKIIISRTDSIGDVMLTLPLAGLLKQLIPGCEVFFLGRTYTLNIIECCPHVDKIINFDELRSKPKQEQSAALEELHADCIIHVFPNKQVAKLAKAAHIPLRIGTTNRTFHWCTCNQLVRLSRKNSSLHEAQLNFVLARPLGAKKTYTIEEVESLLAFTPPAATPEVIKYCSSSKFNLVLHPKSNGNGREWSLDNFGQLIDLLPPEQFNIFITGTQREGDMVRNSLIAPHADKVIDLTGKLSLNELITFLANADGIVSAGTGPLHIAAALGINAIGLFPPTRPIHPGRWAPIGKHVKVFVSKKEYSIFQKSSNRFCMKGIMPEEVAQYLLMIAKKK